VLTVVGVSGMNTATMEISMAANTQYQQDAFQLAEDAIDIALAQKVYAPDLPRTVNWLGTPDYDRRAVTTPRDNMNLNMTGSSVGVIRAFHWDVLAVGRGPRNSISTHTQSFYVPANAN
jgi:PilX N-terminal